MRISAVTPEQVLYGYGPLGVFVVILAWALWKVVNILLQDRNKYRDDCDAMVQDVFTKVLPAVTQNTEYLKSRNELDARLIKALEDSTTQLQASTKAIEEAGYARRFGRGSDRVGGG